MDKNKGGRPTERGEAKTATVAVRTTPTIKEALKAAADEAGRSITQEIERRLEASLSGDKVRRSVDTEALLNDIAREIDQIETARGKRWHTDLGTWSAITEAVRFGPFERARPDKAAEDKFVKAAAEKIKAIHQAKGPHADLLRFAGIISTLNPRIRTRRRYRRPAPNRLAMPPMPSPPSLSDFEGKNLPLLGAYFRDDDQQDTRLAERDAVRTLGHLTDDERAILMKAVNALSELDAMEATAQAELDALMSKYLEAIQEGWDWYKAYRERKAALAEQDDE